MSERTPTEDPTAGPSTGSDAPLMEDLPTDEVPAVAGGQDDSEPEQGEGRQDSY